MAAQKGFYVHLISNVAAATFQNNTPSEFSTILAEDITLPDGNWEVAVKDIMYPSHIATTTEKDKFDIYTYKDAYRKILPVPGGYTPETGQSHVRMQLKLPTAKSDASKADVMDAIAKHINQVITENKMADVLGLKTNGAHTKFILHVYKANIAIVLHPHLRRYLGFKTADKPFLRGSHWAWTPFDLKQKLPTEGAQQIIVSDLLNQINETYILKRSFEFVDDGSNTAAAATKTPQQIYYTAEITLKFKDNKDDDLTWEPTALLTLLPSKGTITLSRRKPIPHEIGQFERRIAFIEFDAPTCTALGLDSSVYLFKHITPTALIIDIPITTPEKLKEVQSIKAKIYFEGLRELDYSLTDKPIDTVTIPESEEVHDPKALLPKLNRKSKKYDYTFKYDLTSRRFGVRTGPNTFIKMSPVLASVLGFTNLSPDLFIYSNKLTIASNVPLLDRAITSLYVYSNIVETVFIGDVKAPILLICPFRKDPHSNVTKLEFLNPSFCKLNRNTIHQIDIAVYDDAGVLVPFLYGKTVLTLHFRKL